MHNEEMRKLAEKIAHVISTDFKTTDFTSLQKSIDSINDRLEKLESVPTVHPSAFIPHPFPIHPSQERFIIAEAIADEVFARLTEEKACTFEPNDKPCDHCAMCSSRGF